MTKFWNICDTVHFLGERKYFPYYAAFFGRKEIFPNVMLNPDSSVWFSGGFPLLVVQLMEWVLIAVLLLLMVVVLR